MSLSQQGCPPVQASHGAVCWLMFNFALIQWISLVLGDEGCIGP